MLPGEIDIYECNEAFAVIDELFARKYPDEIEKYNIFGGALAYGHPYGASGNNNASCFGKHLKKKAVSMRFVLWRQQGSRKCDIDRECRINRKK